MKVVYEKAYAKINLVLNVLGKRTDGYHEVDFLMSTIGIYDQVKISLASKSDIVCKNAPYIKKNSNLAYLVWLDMKKEFDIEEEVLIEITKVIPVSAGMAGGSSDCAAVIRGINKLFNLQLTIEKQKEIGAKFGSDVPFCVEQKTARAQGRGEIVTRINQKLYPLHFVVINPKVGLSTNIVYKNHQIKQDHGSIENFINSKNIDEAISNLHNDLEITSERLEPKIIEIKQYIGKKYNNKMMVSGSGPTVLVVCKDVTEANEIYAYAKEKYKRVYLTKLRG